MDSRIKDAIRSTATTLVEFDERLVAIEKNSREILKIVRAIKKTTVRKYTKHEG